MAIQINTAVLLDTATNISNENLLLRNSYDDIDMIVSNLKKHWSGSACDTCCKKADFIKAKFKDTRYAVVEDFVRFMRLQVGEGYETTETAISSAADAFK